MRDQMSTSDAGQSRAGDFVRLFLCHQRRLFAFLLTVLGNPDDAEDVLQQTSMILWEKFQEFPADGDFAAWGMKTAHFTAKNFLRKQARSRIVFSQEMFEAVSARAFAAAAERDAVQNALEDCLQRLPSADRNLIRQRYELGTSAKSMADHLGLSIHAVYRALARIHAKLFDCVSAKLVSEDA